MKKKGFTMTELLGVIVILGIIILIAFPPLVDQIRKSRNKLTDSAMNLIFNSAEQYLKKNQNEYPIYATNNFCFSLQELVDSGELEISLLNYESGKKLDLTQVVKVYIESDIEIDYEIVEEGECTVVDNTPLVNSDFSGASVPVLDGGMIPVKWNGISWVKADHRNPDNDNRWYNYNNKQWANAVIVNSIVRNDYKNGPVGIAIREEDILAHFVWIPRFNYEIFNFHSLSPNENPFLVEGINIFFEDINDSNYIKYEGSDNGERLTHPAFTFGTEELTGFWVGKFETTGTGSIPTILPNKESLRNRKISDQYATVQLFKEPMYGFSSSVTPRIMKNTEWGAVAYLATSKYGKNNEIWNNPSSSYITGCAGNTIVSIPETECNYRYHTIQGQEASTTGNVYGVYDMNGGALEIVMGSQYNSNGTTINTASSGFESSMINSANTSPFINKYTYGTTSNDMNAYTRSILGDATGEVRGWYSDKSNFINNTNPWFVRGGSFSDGESSGIFSFDHANGGADSKTTVRVVISVKK